MLSLVRKTFTKSSPDPTNALKTLDASLQIWIELLKQNESRRTTFFERNDAARTAILDQIKLLADLRNAELCRLGMEPDGRHIVYSAAERTFHSNRCGGCTDITDELLDVRLAL